MAKFHLLKIYQINQSIDRKHWLGKHIRNMHSRPKYFSIYYCYLADAAVGLPSRHAPSDALTVFAHLDGQCASQSAVVAVVNEQFNAHPEQLITRNVAENDTKPSQLAAM